MEEILFTYKCKVEDKLAAEGKQLPKVRVRCALPCPDLHITLQDIFDDFTEHWVNSSPHRAKSVDSLDSSEKSSGSAGKSQHTPAQRREHREGRRGTRIPAPTFYRSNMGEN